MMKFHGASDMTVIGMYIFYNLVYALASYPLGVVGDSVGLRQTMVTGFFLFAVVYTGMALIYSSIGLAIILFLYGIYAAATEGISKAWISNISASTDVATAIGFYTGWQSLCTLLASSVTGILWQLWSPEAAFIFSSIGTFIVAVYFLLFPFFKSGKPVPTPLTV